VSISYHLFFRSKTQNRLKDATISFKGQPSFWVCSWVVEHLPSISKTLGSTPSTEKIKSHPKPVLCFSAEFQTITHCPYPQLPDLIFYRAKILWTTDISSVMSWPANSNQSRHMRAWCIQYTIHPRGVSLGSLASVLAEQAFSNSWHFFFPTRPGHWGYNWFLLFILTRLWTEVIFSPVLDN
jgi:hypothetical protein